MALPYDPLQNKTGEEQEQSAMQNQHTNRSYPTFLAEVDKDEI